MTETEADPDAALVTRARAGDQRAYGVLVRRHLSATRRAALAIIGSAQADDVVQEALARAYGALGRLEPARPFRPWLLRIVINEALNQRRSAQRHTVLASRLTCLDRPRPAVSADVDCLAAEQRTALFAALEELAPRYRQVVVCRYLLEMSEAETAQVLAISAGTVKSRLSRGLARLRKSGQLERILLLVPPIASAHAPSAQSEPRPTGQHMPSASAVASSTMAAMIVAAVSAGALLLVTGYALLAQPQSANSMSTSATKPVSAPGSGPQNRFPVPAASVPSTYAAIRSSPHVAPPTQPPLPPHELPWGDLTSRAVSSFTSP
jgi:RNA polymerase sigma factor (sigma-70 family)